MIILFLIILLILYVLYKSYVNPIYYMKELTELGYDHLPKGIYRASHITRAQKARRLGKPPPPYPNGWYSVVESINLKVAGVVALDALGLNLCIYRGEDGQARIVDAYCPHLGANLAVGGNVCGNCIECPFHHWRFGEEGQCVSIPGVETVPKSISIKTYPSMEVDGSVWIWYDADGRPPLWTVEESEEVGTWGYRGRSEFLVNAHIQEIPENGADVAHLNAVHNVSVMTDAGYRYPLINKLIGQHKWSAEWSKSNKDHIADIKLTHEYNMMGFNFLELNVKVQQIGPAHVRLRFESALGPMMITQSVTPIGPLLQKVVHRVYSPTYNAPLGLASVMMEAYQFERDVVIWNSKSYVSSPAYVKIDKSIKLFRSWFSQFYSEKSISFKDSLRDNLDW